MQAVLALAAALLAPGGLDCEAVRRAHQTLLEASFTTERRMTMQLNGKLKARVVDRLSYDSGRIERETLSKEIFDKRLRLEEGEGASFAIPFACERLERRDETFVLASKDGKEKVFFVLDPDRGALRPVRWQNREIERFLFKKFVIEADLEYGEFTWR